MRILVLNADYPRFLAWLYRRQPGLENESYAAQMAALMGAHIIKVKPPTNNVSLDAAKKTYEELKAAHVADFQSLFNRVVLDLGGTTKTNQPIGGRKRTLIAGNPAVAVPGAPRSIRQRSVAFRQAFRQAFVGRRTLPHNAPLTSEPEL